MLAPTSALYIKSVTVSYGYQTAVGDQHGYDSPLGDHVIVHQFSVVWLFA
jgi:hypothetical protein